jgi:hypothetical protein
MRERFKQRRHRVCEACQLQALPTPAVRVAKEWKAIPAIRRITLDGDKQDNTPK